jgi:hypothetical protein
LLLVRQYRLLPSPLVRDRLRGWRSGRLERVLDGNFDLMDGGDQRPHLGFLLDYDYCFHHAPDV